MKILTVIGARPQFIKASMVSRAIKATEGLEEIVLHTGQHFDDNMSGIFFEQLGIARPNINLNINGGGHGEMTGRMLSDIEQSIIKYLPDVLMVYGDTNSTLAGALAAVKLHVPVVHVEAGLRSFNMKMPEEVNRILTDQVSSALFCPTQSAVKNLEREGFLSKECEIFNVGDVMQDSSLFYAKQGVAPKDLTRQQGFILATLHRAENTDSFSRLSGIVSALNKVHKEIAPVVIPLHPRTRAMIEKFELKLEVDVVKPVGYFEMLWLLKNCGLVLTDSGGVQKEAFFFGKSCVTMREQTEWVELVDIGANVIVGASENAILSHVEENMCREVVDDKNLYGGGVASKNIAKRLMAM